MIMRCSTCKEDTPAARYQSRTYGAQMRVHNRVKTKAGHPAEARCSVCKTVRPVVQATPEPR